MDFWPDGRERCMRADFDFPFRDPRRRCLPALAGLRPSKDSSPQLLHSARRIHGDDGALSGDVATAWRWQSSDQQVRAFSDGFARGKLRDKRTAC